MDQVNFVEILVDRQNVKEAYGSPVIIRFLSEQYVLHMRLLLIWNF